MTPRNALIAGAVLALGYTVGSVLFGDEATADAQSRSVGIDLRDVQLKGMRVEFLADGGCLLSAQANYIPPAGELGLVVSPQEYPFNGARCNVARNAAANAAARDLKFSDAGNP